MTVRQEIRSGVAVEERFHYDLAGRLDFVWHDGSLQAWWSYDSNGVRIAGTGVGTAVVDAQDRVLSSGGRTYAYDANGRLRERSDATGTTRFEYDEVGGLRSAVLPTGDSVGYVLDPAGRRIARSLNGVVTHRWLWEGSLRPVAEVDSEGEVLTRYVYGLRPNVPEYLVRGDSTYRLVLDERGSVRMVVNAASGSLASSFEYDVWGNLTGSVRPDFQPFGYAGGLHDDATGLVRFGARDYSPELGRWTAKDPIGFNGGDVNLYSYSGSSPIEYSDPSGLSSINHFAEGSTIANAADQLIAPDGWIYIKGHGSLTRDANFGAPIYPNGDFIDVEVMIDEIGMQDDFFTNSNILLANCNAGAGSFAKMLAKRLRERSPSWIGKVFAPDSMIFFDSTNTKPTPYGPTPGQFPYAPDSTKKGRWRSF